MKKSYNQFAGQSIERLAALSDGIFGVAMTLLLLDLHTPAQELIHSEADLRSQLLQLAPLLLVYLMSFLTLGIFWVGQQAQLNCIEKSDRDVTWLHLAFLFLVTLMPFTTRLLIDFLTYRTALLVYWANILLLGLLLYCTWRLAIRANLIRENVTLEIKSTLCRRIVNTQIWYAAGASLCIFNTYVSISAIVLIQLYYAVAPFHHRKPAKLA